MNKRYLYYNISNAINFKTILNLLKLLKVYTELKLIKKSVASKIYLFISITFNFFLRKFKDQKSYEPIIKGFYENLYFNI